MAGEESLEERLERFIAEAKEMKERLEDIALDEMCEARAYRDMAKACGDEEARWKLFLVAFDSIVHREIAWALMRALTSTIVLAKEMLVYTPSPEEARKIADTLEAHTGMERLAESSYEDLIALAPRGSTLRRLLELLAEEEKKHESIARAVVEELRSGGSRRAAGAHPQR